MNTPIYKGSDDVSIILNYKLILPKAKYLSSLYKL